MLWQAAWMVGHFARMRHATVTTRMHFNSLCNMQSLLACNKYTVFPNTDMMYAKYMFYKSTGTSEMKNILQMFRDIEMAQA